jgi:predicted transcriptional regulator
MSVGFEQLEREHKRRNHLKPTYYRNKYVTCHEIIKLILDGKRSRTGILLSERSGNYVSKRKYLNMMLKFQLLRVELFYDKQRKAYIDNYSITDKGMRFYVLMGHLMEMLVWK